MISTWILAAKAAIKSLPFWIAFGVGVIVGGLVIGVICYEVGFHKGNTFGYSRYAAEQAAADNQANKSRHADDSRINGLSDYNACVDSLKHRRLQVDACEQLRGIQPQ